MAVKPMHTEDDVDRWEQVSRQMMEILLHRVNHEPGHDAIVGGRGWVMLANKCLTIAMAHIARGKHEVALGWLACSVKSECRLFEARLQGENVELGYFDAGEWQHLLHAFASHDKAMLDRFNNLFDLELLLRPDAPNTKDSIYHSRLLKALADHQIEDALTILAEPRPKVEPMFQGYIECMEAITKNDQPRFEQALAVASTSWEENARRHLKGLPEAVCFLHGVGLVRLAEHVWDTPVFVDDPNIPAELQGNVKPERVDLGI